MGKIKNWKEEKFIFNEDKTLLIWTLPISHKKEVSDSVFKTENNITELK
jgi:hypothetical protein